MSEECLYFHDLEISRLNPIENKWNQVKRERDNPSPIDKILMDNIKKIWHEAPEIKKSAHSLHRQYFKKDSKQ